MLRLFLTRIATGMYWVRSGAARPAGVVRCLGKNRPSTGRNTSLSALLFFRINSQEEDKRRYSTAPCPHPEYNFELLDRPVALLVQLEQWLRPCLLSPADQRHLPLISIDLLPGLSPHWLIANIMSSCSNVLSRFLMQSTSDGFSRTVSS